MNTLEFSCSGIELSDLIQIAGTVITVVVPLIVLLVTLCVQGKRHKESMKQQKDQFEKQLEITKNNFREQLKQGDEGIRATYMPFLHLEKKAEFGTRDNQITIQLFFQNQGNGTAFKTKVICCEDDATNLLFVCDARTSLGVISCRYAAPFYDNTISVHCSSSCEFILDKEMPGQNRDLSMSDIRGEFSFKVSFLDALKNEYHQEFLFQFWGKSVGWVVSQMPELQVAKTEETMDI